MYQFRKMFLRLFQDVALAWETAWAAIWLVALAVVYLLLYPVVVGVFTVLFYASLMLGRARGARMLNEQSYDEA